MRAAIVTLALLFTATAALSQKAPFNGSAVQFAEFAAAYERMRAAGNRMPSEDAEDIGYFTGFVDGVFVSQRWPCFSDLVSRDQVRTVVAKYFRENPERWNLEARDLVIDAANRVWGCKSVPTSPPAKK
jgi:hypothetical protein